jgi:hypothetical protein
LLIIYILYLFIYIIFVKDKIKDAIIEMVRISRKALVLLEWHDSNCGVRGVNIGHWARDYVTLLKEYLIQDRIEALQISEDLWQDKNWQKYGYIIKATLCGNCYH